MLFDIGFFGRRFEIRNFVLGESLESFGCEPRIDVPFSGCREVEFEVSIGFVDIDNRVWSFPNRLELLFASFVIGPSQQDSIALVEVDFRIASVPGSQGLSVPCQDNCIVSFRVVDDLVANEVVCVWDFALVRLLIFDRPRSISCEEFDRCLADIRSWSLVDSSSES